MADNMISFCLRIPFVEVKVNLPLFLTNYHAMKMYGELHTLTSALDGGEWSALRSGRFNPENEPPIPIK
jgi:hypothetical protein